MGERLKRLKKSLTDAVGASMSLEVYGCGELLITGCICLVDFSPVSVIADTVDGRVEIRGEDMSVCAYRGDILSVCGRIISIEMEGDRIC